MKRFAALLDRLSYEPARLAKLRLLSEYFSSVPDPDRGYGLAAIAGTLTFSHAKPGLIRSLIAERTDPVLFAFSYDYVGDLAETVALMWRGQSGSRAPSLSEVVDSLASGARGSQAQRLADWLDRLEETERWALLKLITGALRIGLSLRLAKLALADMAAGCGIAVDVSAIDEIWHGLTPPYIGLFAWIEGRGPPPIVSDPAPFRPAMLAHALEEAELESMRPDDFVAEWKWDGIRAQLVAGTPAEGGRAMRLFSRTGEDISPGFPDLLCTIPASEAGFCLDGELLIVRAGEVLSFNALQQRLNRRQVPSRLQQEFPIHFRAYDLLFDSGEDLRQMPLSLRRSRLEALIARLGSDNIDVSPILSFSSWDEVAAARRDPAAYGGGAAVEGLMLKRRQSQYIAGRPRGEWLKWKHDPFTVDAILMYAQRGHGKRSSFYSDFTFGVWRGHEVVPVGKTYFGFSDAELVELDRFIRSHTINRFGPVREVVHGPEQGLVLEIAFEGLSPSPRHKSGLAMRFPRISRIRWDKPVGEADTIDSLQHLMSVRASR